MRWGVRRFFVGALLFAFLVGLPGAAPTLASAEAVPAAQRPGFSFDYDVHSAATTAARHTRSHAFRAYDLTGNVSNSRTRSSGAVPATKGADEGTEIVQRGMSRAELEATQKTGLVRGGRPGTHYVTDNANSSALRARQRLALPQTPELIVDLRVPGGVFGSPTRVRPNFGMPGGGLERRGTGRIPCQVVGVRSC